MWRLVRVDGDTKTKKSRRTLALPLRCVEALHQHQRRQQRDRERTGKRWHETGLVFTTSLGTALDAANVRRTFRRVVRADTRVTEAVYRHQLRPVLLAGTVAMDRIFQPAPPRHSDA